MTRTTSSRLAWSRHCSVSASATSTMPNTAACSSRISTVPPFVPGAAAVPHRLALAAALVVDIRRGWRWLAGTGRCRRRLGRRQSGRLGLGRLGLS